MSVADMFSETYWNDEHRRLSLAASYCRLSSQKCWYFQARNGSERVLAALLLVLAAPILGLLMLAIRLSSRGPAIYRQRRVGWRGRIFVMYKLRTMHCDAELRTGPVWADANVDPRTTPVGRWLRHLHLDELPQLYNIVRGEMSFVGPRPERPEFVVLLSEQIPGYLDRLCVLPGVTGLAQVNLPADTDVNSVRRKLVLDKEYIDSAGLLMDARIIVCTILRLIGLRGGRAVSLMGLTRTVELPPEIPPKTQHSEIQATSSADLPARASLAPRQPPAQAAADSYVRPADQQLVAAR